MTSTEAAAMEDTKTTTPPVTIRYRFNMAPDRVIVTEPSLREIGKELNKVDLAVFLGTVLVPSIYGYRVQKSFSTFYFRFGLGAGLFAGAVYAYSRSFCRLTGLSIPTPKYIASNEN